MIEMNGMRRFAGLRALALTLAVALASFALPVATAVAEDAPPEPRQVVRETVDAVIGVLQESGKSDAERRSEIEQIAYARFDFKTMSRLVLARNWKRFSKEQQAAFVDEFKAFLSRSYGQRISSYEQEKVEITSDRLEPRGDVTVLTEIRGGQFDGTEVHYRMRNRGEWRVIDVVIEGVSLVSNYRTQFKEIISSGGSKGPQKLLDQLKTKNDAPGVAG